MTVVDILAGAISGAANSGDPVAVIAGAFIVCFAIPAAWFVVRCGRWGA